MWDRLTSGDHSDFGGAVAPAPRAFHASWAQGEEVYIHGGEGPTGAKNCEDDFLEGISRDPFAEEEGGQSFNHERVAKGSNGIASSRAHLTTSQQQQPEEVSPHNQEKNVTTMLRQQASVSVFEDLWKLDVGKLRWERVRYL